MARCYTWSEYPFSLDNSMSMRTANVNISPKTPFPELDVELSSHLDPRSGQETPYLEQLEVGSDSSCCQCLMERPV